MSQLRSERPLSQTIAFAGTADFAVPSLEAVHAGGAHIPWVLTQPDRPAGRGRRLTAPPVKRAAEALGLNVRQPAMLRTESPWAAPPDLLVVAAYGLLLPRWLLDWPRLGCVNVHASLLPRWRGASPIQQAIIAGDRESGVSIMRVAPALDTGPVFAQRAVAVGRQETAGELHDRLAVLGAELLAEVLPAIVAGELGASPQDEARATYAPKIDKADARLDWRQPAEALARRVRAYNPWPVAETYLSDGRRLRVWQAEAVAGEGSRDGQPRAPSGAILAADREGIDVAASPGILRLRVVQPPSAKAMDVAAYLAAHSVEGLAFV